MVHSFDINTNLGNRSQFDPLYCYTLDVLLPMITEVNAILSVISKNIGKFFVGNISELTNRIYCTSQHEALMKTVPLNDEAYWLETICYNFLI